MLTTTERLLFLFLVLITIYLAAKAIQRLVRIIGRGHGRPDWALALRRAISVGLKTLSFAPVFRSRLGTSLMHGLVGWGFIYYLLVNLGDVLEGYLPGFDFLGSKGLGDWYRLGADFLSVGVLVGMTVLLIRRFVARPAALDVRASTLLNAKARSGIRRDSAIVGAFILVHVGSRFLGQSFELAGAGTAAVSAGTAAASAVSAGWQPLAGSLSLLWLNWSPQAVEFARHAFWWVALGTILGFIPYFPYTKHLHLFMGPINFLLQPERRSMGALDPLDFEDETQEEFGVERLEQLSYKGLLDAYACIMCNRCQEACPAYETGKVLSPAALEINKRYFLNHEGTTLANGQASSQTLLEFAITPEAVWACTACGACVEVCPVGNEPMRDILEIRRHLVLMENDFPEQLQAAYRGMERAANPWNIAPEERMKWADGLKVPTVAQNPEPEILWWVGCAPATDPRAQRTAQAFAKILNAAGVDFAVLGTQERCSGDAARRSGNEYLFNELASANVETLNQVNPPRIVTTCPHCLHTLKTEYPAFGGNYQVIHHSQLIGELEAAGRLPSHAAAEGDAVTFHDPCYLGRQNGVVDAPRDAFLMAGVELAEMPRHGSKSFCCGAGGAQMWKEEEAGDERVSADRFREAQATGAATLAVGCPFCMIMLSDAAGDQMPVRDLAEIVADRLD